MAKFVITYDNLSKVRDEKPVEQHDVIEATSKEEAETTLEGIKRKEKINIKIKKINIYKGTKNALNEGKR